jgi:hypothetical protein
VSGIQFDPNGDHLLVFKFSASLTSNKTAGQEESDSEGTPAAATPPVAAPATGTFAGGGNSGDVSIFGGGSSSGDSVVFGGGGSDFTIAIPVTVVKP